MLAPSFPVDAHAQDARAKRAVKKNDRDGDGRVSRREWRKSCDIFDSIDTDGDGFLTFGEFRARFGGGRTKKTKTTKRRTKSATPTKSVAAPVAKG